MENTNNGNGNGAVVADLNYASINEFLDHANEQEFNAFAEKLSRQGYRFLRNRQSFNKLPLLERISRKVDEFKHNLINRAAALGAFNAAYGSGGRTKIRDGINAYCNYIVENFKVIDDLAVKIIVDLIRGKKFEEVLVNMNLFMTNIVCEIKKDPKNIATIRTLFCELKDSFSKNMKDLLNNDDPLEFPGKIELFNENGVVRSDKDIKTELNTNRCTHIRGLIIDFLNSVKNRYNEAYTNFIKAGSSHEEALVKVEKQFDRNIPSELPTEKTLKKQLASENYEELCKLYNALKREWL